MYQTHVRSSVTGRFVPDHRAETSPKTTETEHIHYPALKKQ